MAVATGYGGLVNSERYVLHAENATATLTRRRNPWKRKERKRVEKEPMEMEKDEQEMH